MCNRPNKSKRLISLLVPLGGDDPYRQKVWHWLERYWKDQLGDTCEIVVGTDCRNRKRWKREAFSKAAAVNDAFKKSHGDIIVILDADAYFPGDKITHAAARLRKQRKAGVHSWFVPYRLLFRLTRVATEDVIASDPANPLTFPTPPPPGTTKLLMDLDGATSLGPCVRSCLVKLSLQ